jgi:hypothetical protein
MTASAVFAVVLTGMFGAAWAEDDDQITPLAAGASISHDFVKDWQHESGDDEWDWHSAASANAGGSAALLAPLKPGVFGTSEEATFSRDRMQNQLDTANGLSLHLTEVNDARVLANETGLFTPGGGINGILMKIVRAIFGSLLWLVYIVAMAVQKILEATMTVVGSLNPAKIFIGVEGLNPTSGTVVDGLTIEDSGSQLRDFWSAAQGTGIVIVGLLGAIGLASSLLGSHKMSKVFRSTLTRLLFLVAFLPLAFGLFGTVVDWAANAISSSASASNEVVLTHMIDTEAWAAHNFDIPSDSLCGTVGAEKTEIDSNVLASIIIPGDKSSSVANEINSNNGITSDDAMALLGKWLSSSSVSASEVSAIVHDQLIANSDVETVKGAIEDMIDKPGDEDEGDDAYVLVSGGTMSKSGNCYAGKFSPIGTIAFGSLESKNNSVTIKTASSSATSVGFNDLGIQSVSMVGQGFNGFLVYVLMLVLLACPAFLGIMYGWGLVSETIKIGVRMVGHVTLGFFGSLRSIIAAVVGFCGLMTSIIATVVLYVLSSILLGVLPGRITGSIVALTGSGATDSWILPVGIILGCVIAVVMTFSLIKLRGAIVGGVGAAMSRILAKLVGFDDLEAQRAGDEAVSQSGVNLAGSDADALGKSAKKGAGAAASLAVGAAMGGAGGLMGRAGAAIGSMMKVGGGSGPGSGSGGGSGSSSGSGGSGSAGGTPAGGGSSAGSAGGAPAGGGSGGSGADDGDGSDDDSSADGDGAGSDAGDTDVDASSGDTDVDASSDVDVDGSAEAQGQPGADGRAADDGGDESPGASDDAGQASGSAPADGGNGETSGSNASSGETHSAEPADQQTGPPDQVMPQNSADQHTGSHNQAVSEGSAEAADQHTGPPDQAVPQDSTAPTSPSTDQPAPGPTQQPSPPAEGRQSDQGGAPKQSAPAPDQTAGQHRAETEADETRRFAAEDKARLAAAAAPAAWANARLNPLSERRFQRRQAKTAQGQDYAEKKLRDFNQATAQLKAAERMAQANPSRAAKRQLQQAQAKAAKAGQQTLVAAKRVGSTARMDDRGRMRLQHVDPQPGQLLEQRRKAGARRDRRRARKQQAGRPGSPNSSNSPS